VLYALTGMVAFLFRKCRVKALLIWATCLFVFTTLMFGGASYQMRKRPGRPHPGCDRETGQAMEWHGRIRDPAGGQERRGNPSRARVGRRAHRAYADQAHRRPVHVLRSGSASRRWR
jgi:hypothetical protein